MIRTPWFFPLGLLVGGLCTREGVLRRRMASRDRRCRDWWLLLILAWIPTLAWILSQWRAQY
ncbi:MAG: hypothetical protein HY823_13790 [Acidobacteria bacterium]|nr:hypothetical protein [Acidobacteriota bacterium]